jgi:hypothetical protein
VTNLTIIVVLALAAERLVLAYFTWTLAKRKGRLWFAYVIFGLVGYIVLALRSANSSVLDDSPRVLSRSAYTHTGFGRPNENETALEPRRKRSTPLAGYHVPRGQATSRVR